MLRADGFVATLVLSRLSAPKQTSSFHCPELERLSVRCSYSLTMLRLDIDPGALVTSASILLPYRGKGSFRAHEGELGT